MIYSGFVNKKRTLAIFFLTKLSLINQYQIKQEKVNDYSILPDQGKAFFEFSDYDAFPDAGETESKPVAEKK